MGEGRSADRGPAFQAKALLRWHQEKTVKTSKHVWLIWGSALALSLAVVAASSRAGSPLIQALGSAFLFVPILVATAFLKDERKP